jgi:ParB-like nuclease domain
MKKTDRIYVELDLASIVCAKENLRDTAPWLSKRGYSIFQPTDTQQHSLASLALSDDSQQQAEYVSLIEQNEPTIKELSDNMAVNGQLEPIRVRSTEERDKYDLVFGARRVLARLYTYAKSAGKIPARLTAEVVEQDPRTPCTPRSRRTSGWSPAPLTTPATTNGFARASP